MKIEEFVKISIPGNHTIFYDNKYITSTYLEQVVKNPKLPKCVECKKELGVNESEKCFNCLGIRWSDNPQLQSLR